MQITNNNGVNVLTKSNRDRFFRMAFLTYTLCSTAFWPVNANVSINKAFNVSNLQSSPFVGWAVNPTGTPSINLVGAWNKFQKKGSVIVAVIDTGIDYPHPFLTKNHHVYERTLSSYNYGVDFSSNDIVRKYTPKDGHGHGTHISGIIRSVHPGIKILTLKYYNQNASGLENLNATIRALEYAVNKNVDIINYSGGGPNPSPRELRIFKEAERKGIIVVAAAGNERSNIDIERNAYYPASYNLSNIISVMAHDRNLKIIPSSNYGRKSVDIAAPGEGIKSSLPGGRSGYLTGTSQATTFVTGVVALIKSKYPKLSYRVIKNIILTSVKKNAVFEKKCRSKGRLDATKAMITADEIIGGKSRKTSITRL